MQTRYVPRAIEPEIRAALARAPAVAILGPRQCGKSTLARRIAAARRDALYLDLERPSDRARLAEPELFLERHAGRLVCLDEIQRLPEIFAVLRSLIDARRRPGRFLILGSASRELLRQSSESLAGRIAHFELTPFRADEAGRAAGRLWPRGGFPESLLARSEAASVAWRRDFVRTFLERDLPQLGVRVPAATLSRFWRMCAHHHGQLLNQSQLGAALGISHVTVRSYLELLSATFMIRLLPPLLPNLRKRLVKSPRVYLRDPGILHSLLEIETADDLLGHPVRGASWEGWVIENAIAAFAGWRAHFYRAATGAELDLVLEKGSRRIGVECKASAAPSVGRSFWAALEDLGIREAWVVAPVESGFPLGKGTRVAGLREFMRRAAR
ncbi:MAG: ATP-binding protein [Pseudomonadota bacterium]